MVSFKEKMQSSTLDFAASTPTHCIQTPTYRSLDARPSSSSVVD